MQKSKLQFKNMINFNQTGLILSFLGSIFLVVSYGNPFFPDSSYTTNGKGRKYAFVYLRYPFLFKTGLYLICIGFFIILFDSFK